MNINDTANFFLVYPLNFEDLGALEIEEKLKTYFPEESYTLEKLYGGINLICSIRIGVSLNHILRSPTRILLRVTHFKCRDFPKLFHKISKINWSFLLLGVPPPVEVSSKSSRLFDSRKIHKAVEDGIKEYYRKQPAKKKYLDLADTIPFEELPRIYLRFEDDICTISIDTTGKRLHLRDEKLLTGHAPIRENLAYLLLTELEIHLKNKTYGNFQLIDPMCGSGTFLLEAKNRNSLTTNRVFSYQKIPLAMDVPIDFKQQGELSQSKFETFLGLDIDENIVEQAKKNSTDIDILHDDFFSHKNFDFSNPVIVTNPPYGIRVGSNIDSHFYEKIIEQSYRKFSAKFLGIIIPNEHTIRLPAFCKMLSKRDFSNGGIAVSFYVLELR
jgi:putative N6-adenine-specific DNA methylase